MGALTPLEEEMPQAFKVGRKAGGEGGKPGNPPRVEWASLQGCGDEVVSSRLLPAFISLSFHPLFAVSSHLPHPLTRPPF